MIQTKDYLSYVASNKDLLELLENNSSILYYHLKDVVYVCDYISDFFSKNKKNESNDDLNIIFETGFKYLYEQLEQIKLS